MGSSSIEASPANSDAGSPLIVPLTAPMLGKSESEWAELAPEKDGDEKDSDEDFEEEADGSSDTNGLEVLHLDGATKMKSTTKWYFADNFKIWVDEKQWAKKKASYESDKKSYENNLQLVGEFNYVQQFWRYWNNIDRLAMKNASLCVFKDPIKPMWEDAANQNGGRWIMHHSNKALMTEYHTELVLGYIGGYFRDIMKASDDDICGILLKAAVGKTPMRIEIWNRRANKENLIDMDYAIRDLLQLQDLQNNAATNTVRNQDFEITYKDHNATITHSQKQRNKYSDKKPAGAPAEEAAPVAAKEAATPVAAEEAAPEAVVVEEA